MPSSWSSCTSWRSPACQVTLPALSSRYLNSEASRRRSDTLSRRDRSPCRRRTPPSLLDDIVSDRVLVLVLSSMRFDLPSSAFSSAGASAEAAAPPAAAPPAAGAAAPPEPTFRRRSLTSLPSRALAKREVQMGSISGTLAAEMRAWSLSACLRKYVSECAMRW